MTQRKVWNDHFEISSMLAEGIVCAIEDSASSPGRSEKRIAAVREALTDAQSRALRLFEQAMARHSERDGQAPLRHIVGR